MVCACVIALGVKMKTKRKKLPSIKKLKDKLDDVFQMYIRERDGWKCCVCGKVLLKDRTNMHAGHFISRKEHSTRWDERNVNSQCKYHNFLQSLGDIETITKYESFLKIKYGEQIIDDLIAKSHEIYHLNRGELEDKINYYTEKLKEYQ